MKEMKNSIKIKAKGLYAKKSCILADKRDEGYIDTAIVILISVVLGALRLAGSYALFGDVVLPELTSRINEMFNYAG